MLVKKDCDVGCVGIDTCTYLAPLLCLGDAPHRGRRRAEQRHQRKHDPHGAVLQDELRASDRKCRKRHCSEEKPLAKRFATTSTEDTIQLRK
jgi:hypothetical protein